MLSFRRRKSTSSLSVFEETSANHSIASTTTQKTECLALRLPKNLEDVMKSQHGNLPKNLPGENASQEEVRYYLYSILTCKDSNTAKTYPQWVLETCMSWEGNGQKLRDMTDEELQILCPLRAGYAEINSSRKQKLDDLPLPAARQSIGAAIARAVAASRVTESRRSGAPQEWDNPSLNRLSQRFGSVRDLPKHMSEPQLSMSTHVRLQPSLTNLSRPDSLYSFRLENPGARTFYPNLPDVNESHNDANYFPRQSFVPPSRPTPLRRHVNPATCFQSVDSSRVESPSSSNYPLGSIMSEESTSTSQTSLAVPEGSPDIFLSTKIDRHLSSASPSTSIKQPTPRYEHKETLAELEAGPVELDARQESPVSVSIPRRYRSTPSIHSISVRNSPTISANDTLQPNEFPRPSGLRTAIQSDDFEQPQSSYYSHHEPPTNTHHVSTSGSSIHDGRPGWRSKAVYNSAHHDGYVCQLQGQIDGQAILCNTHDFNNQPLSVKIYRLRPCNTLQPRAPTLENCASVSALSAQDVPIHPSLVRRISRPYLQNLNEPMNLQGQDASFHLPGWNSSRNSTVNVTSQTPKQQPDTIQHQAPLRKNSRPRLFCFQSDHMSTLKRMPSVSAVAATKPGVQTHLNSISKMGEVGVFNGLTPNASRTANKPRNDSLASDQAEFHVWKANLPTDKPIMPHADGNELFKSQGEHVAQRSRDKKSRNAWNSDFCDRKGVAGPSIRYIDSVSRQPKQTFYEAIEQREILEGKPQRGVDRGLAQDWRRYH